MFAKGFVALAMALSIGVVLAVPLEFLGLSSTLGVAGGFGLAVPSLLLSAFAFRLNRQYGLHELGLPPLLFRLLLLGGLVPLFIAVAAWGVLYLQGGA